MLRDVYVEAQFISAKGPGSLSVFDNIPQAAKLIGNAMESKPDHAESVCNVELSLAGEIVLVRGFEKFSQVCHFWDSFQLCFSLAIFLAIEKTGLST